MFVAIGASGIALISQPLFAKCAINPEYYASKHRTCSAAIPADGSVPGRLEPSPHTVTAIATMIAAAAKAHATGARDALFLDGAIAFIHRKAAD
jgi:hypothetical protein